MMTVIRVDKLNEVHLRFYCEDSGVEAEIVDYFTYDYPNAKFTPQYKARLWDGKVRLADPIRKTLYVGLLDYLIKFAETNGYTVEQTTAIQSVNNVTHEQVQSFVESLQIHGKGQQLEVRPYQLEAIHHAILNKRAVLLSPTGCLDPDTMIDVVLNTESSPTKITLCELEHLVANHQYVGINTPTGIEKITDTYRKFGAGREITFNDGSSISCADKHLFWKDDWTPADQVQVGDSIGSKKVSSISEVPPQEWIDFSVDASHESYYHNDILHHNSGKSLIIYSFCRHLIEQNKKIIIVVPTTSLVRQMYNDFCDYSVINQWDVPEHCQILYSGFSKHFEKNILITTWQSVVKLDKQWFNQFDAVIGDECHLFAAKSLTSIMEKMATVQYRIGTTGSLDDKKIHKLVLEGIFGKVHRVTSTNQLQKQGQLANLNIHSILLKYDEQTRKNNNKLEYQAEVDFLISNARRNKFIRNLALSCKGTTLVLFQFVEKHGKVLYDDIKQKAGDRPVYFIHGNVDVDEREQIRQNLSLQKIILSFGDVQVSVLSNTEVKLSDGSVKRADLITEHDDVDEHWINTNKGIQQ